MTVTLTAASATPRVYREDPERRVSGQDVGSVFDTLMSDLKTEVRDTYRLQQAAHEVRLQEGKLSLFFPGQQLPPAVQNVYKRLETLIDNELKKRSLFSASRMQLRLYTRTDPETGFSRAVVTCTDNLKKSITRVLKQTFVGKREVYSRTESSPFKVRQPPTDEETEGNGWRYVGINRLQRREDREDSRLHNVEIHTTDTIIGPGDDYPFRHFRDRKTT